MYYITRDLSPNKIEQFSRSCFPQASECSLPLNLAMNKFYRKMGVKTKLLSLHERMKILEKKISNLLTNQEYILKKIVNKWCDFFKVRQDSSFHEKFQTFLLNTVNVTLFDELLSATISLGNELENFKIACQRVLIIEEERNNIVEHVFSIPVEERLSRNGLLELHEEKIHLEAEIKRLRQLHGCQIGKGQMNELNVVENILQNLQHELNNNFLKNDENCITRMLQKINLEARMLLQLTKEQKRWRFNIPNLNRILFLFLMAVDNKDYPEDCQSAEEKWFFSQLKEAVIAWQTQLSQDNHVLKVKVKNLTSDNIQLNLQSKSLEQELKEVKFENATEVHRLKRERDIFKSQVKDLQIIREAYAQLVDKQPTITQNERDLLLRLHEKDLRISELEDLEEKFRGEIKNLHDNMQVTNKQMQVLNKFFNVTIKPILVGTKCLKISLSL
ncbi:hypothetical protein ABEB36_007263 [Hypothenemus hampei]|uniref:Uncharacterized protein n=1 Tax=Hypothenemus hampei TaxID=57062 RepID=A0ABD1EU92_HYPHA